MIVKMLDEADFQRVAAALDPVGDVVHHAGAGTGGELRVGRNHQHAFDAVALELVKNTGDRGLPVAHGPGHKDIRRAGLPQPALEQLGLPLGMHLERRSFRHPDLGVLGRRFGRTQVEHEEIEDQPPDRARNLDYTRIPEKLLEVAAQCRSGRRLWRTEVHQQEGGAARGAVIGRGFGSVAGHVRVWKGRRKAVWP